MIDYILPNGAKVDIDGCIEATLTKTEFPTHFFDTVSGNVCIIENRDSLLKLVEKIGESKRYLSLLKFDDEDYTNIFKDFIKDILAIMAKRKLIVEIKEALKTGGWQKAVSVLEKDDDGFIDAWSQYIHDEAFELVVAWLKNIPNVDIVEKFNGTCDCLLCKSIENDITDIDTLKELFTQQNEKNKYSKEKKKIKIKKSIEKPKNIFQLKIELANSKPLVWRRVLVSDISTFFELHCVIQDVMGWYNCHLHHFSNKSFYGRKDDYTIIKYPHESDEDYSLSKRSILDERETLINKFLKKEGDKLYYEYDFGDSWMHTIKLEKIIPYTDEVKLPEIVTGKNRCPPEDSGSIWGYYDKIEILKNKNHPEHEIVLEWMSEVMDGVTYNNKDDSINIDSLTDVTYFNKDDIVWSDTDEELKTAEEFNNY